MFDWYRGTDRFYIEDNKRYRKNMNSYLDSLIEMIWGNIEEVVKNETEMVLADL